MKKKSFRIFLKITAAGILAFLGLTVFCGLYYNVPAHASSDDRATDYKWAANTFYSRGTEGFAWGRTNNDGYINPVDYQAGMPVDILIMGSSHMEAFQVAMEDSTAGRLAALLPEKTVYNIGISAHNLLNCAQNLEAAVEKYRPADYVVIDTATVVFPDDLLQETVAGVLPEISVTTGGIAGLLEHNPFLRRSAAQLQSFQKKEAGNDEEAQPSTQQPVAENSEAPLNALLQKMQTDAAKSGAKLVSVFHPSLHLNKDGTLEIERDDEQTAHFSRLCTQNGILFLDMSERFLEEYQSCYRLPYGFTNSSAGTGHLNVTGHRLVAEALWEAFEEVGQ